MEGIAVVSVGTPLIRPTARFAPIAATAKSTTMPTTAATATAIPNGERAPTAALDAAPPPLLSASCRFTAGDDVQYGVMPLTQSGNLNDVSVSKNEHGEHTTETHAPAAFVSKHCTFLQTPLVASWAVSEPEHSFALGGGGRTDPGGGGTNTGGGGSGANELQLLSAADCALSPYLQKRHLETQSLWLVVHVWSHIAQIPKLGCTSDSIASEHRFAAGAPGIGAGTAGAVGGATHAGRLDDADVSKNLQSGHVDLRHWPRDHWEHTTFVQMPLSACDGWIELEQRFEPGVLVVVGTVGKSQHADRCPDAAVSFVLQKRQNESTHPAPGSVKHEMSVTTAMPWSASPGDTTRLHACGVIWPLSATVATGAGAVDGDGVKTLVGAVEPLTDGTGVGALVGA